MAGLMPHPRNGQFSKQFDAMNQRRQAADSYDSQRSAARESLHGQNMRTYASMGVPSQQDQANRFTAGLAILGERPPARGDMSGFGQRQLTVPQSSGPMVNNRGDGSFTPANTAVNRNVMTGELGGLYVPNNRGGAPRFQEGETVTNSAGGKTVIGRTPNGGLSFTGQFNPETRRTGGVAMTPQLQERLSSRAQQRRDEKILRNANRYGLGDNVAAVGAARGRIQQRSGMTGQRRALMDAIMETHMEHASSLSPLDRIQYLQSLVQGNGSPMPAAATAASQPKRMPIMSAVDELSRLNKAGLLKRDPK